jgi:hypothetical protein
MREGGGGVQITLSKGDVGHAVGQRQVAGAACVECATQHQLTHLL